MPMKIFDFRFRPNTKKILDGIANSSMFKASCEASGFDKRVAQTLPEIMEDLKKRNVFGCVITGRDCQTTYGFPDNNGSVLEFCQAYPDFFYGFWGVDPHRGMAAVRDVEKVVKEYGMRGIATDPYLAHIPPSEARYYPIYAKCCELGVPVFITTAPPPAVQGALIDYTDPRDVDKVARDFPELTIIMSHGGYPYVQEAIFVAQRNPNVYMDCSEYELAPMATHYVEALTTGVLADKIIFASAHPFVEQADAIAAYMNMGLKQETLEKVMYKNACRVLGLNAPCCAPDDLSCKLAEVTKGLSDSEKESLRKILEGVSSQILQKAGITK